MLQVVITIDPHDEEVMAFWKDFNPEVYAIFEAGNNKTENKRASAVPAPPLLPKHWPTNCVLQLLSRGQKK